MQDYKLPILKKHLEMIYAALSVYRQSGMRDLTAEEIIAEQTKARDAISKANGDVNMIIKKMMSAEEDILRAKMNAFKEEEADLDILIARIQVLRKKLTEQKDSIMIENFLKEIV